MSKSFAHLSGQTLWFSDEPFAVWLRMMALNLEPPLPGDSAWHNEITDCWLSTSQLVGVSNAMGVHFDEDFSELAKTSVLYRAMRKVDEILRRFDDESFQDAVLALGFTECEARLASLVETRAVGSDLMSLLAVPERDAPDGKAILRGSLLA